MTTEVDTDQLPDVSEIEESWEKIGFTEENTQCDRCTRDARWKNEKLQEVFDAYDDEEDAVLCLRHYRMWLLTRRFGHLLE